MGSYFLDSSAIIKRYFSEQGHAWSVNLHDPEQGNDLYIAQVALVEVVATICRKAREQHITLAERDRLIAKFRQDSQEGYTIQLVTASLYTTAGDLCRLHKLRAYDAVQLACALAVRDDALANETSAPIFVSADNDLINTAVAEGLDVENPNDYPG